MPVREEVRGAVAALARVRSHLKDPEIPSGVDPEVGAQLARLSAVLEDPMLDRMLIIQESLCRLRCQLAAHPSLLPADFDIVPDSGELAVRLAAPDPRPRAPDPRRPPRPPLTDGAEPDTGSPEEPPPVTGEAAQEQERTHSREDSVELEDIDLEVSAQTPIMTGTYERELERAIAEVARGREVVYIELCKEDGAGLGFSVAGLASAQNEELGIFVQGIQPGGTAHSDGRLREGDQILAIDGQPLDANVSHPQAITILQKARGLVKLVVARCPDPAAETGLPAELLTSLQVETPQQPDMVLNTEWAQVEVIDLVNDGTGLGFGIIGGRSSGVVVKTILPGGVADRDGRLQSGDHILRIGEHNLRGMESVQVAQVLRTAGTEVQLVVARPLDSASPELQPTDSVMAGAPILPTRLLADPDELEHQLQLLQNGFPEPYTGDQLAEERDSLMNGVTMGDYDVTPVNQLGPSPLHLLPDTETADVELVKDAAGLGVTIAGYVCEREELSGIFIKSVNPGSAADLSGRVAVNDQIIEVDGTPLQGYSNHQAVELLKSTGPVVRLRLARYVSGPKYHQLRQAIARTELTTPAARPLLHDTQGMDSDPDAGAAEGYGGPLSPELGHGLQTQWSGLLGPGYDVVVAEVSKSEPGGGLGLSLEGTVDVEGGREVRPRHFIRSVLADGPVGVDGRLRSGDELLEVNGRRLVGLSHMEVVSVLRELPRDVRLVCARAWQTDSPSTPDGSGPASTGGLSSVPGGGCPSERLPKAKSDSSLASSTASVTDSSQSRLRSRSMEPLSGLAMWAAEPLIVTLEKGERGLGFSILDYQDPMNPNETVIVIRSLVPGGAAQLDGRLIPGDRLVSVNAVLLENASLDRAVQALKGAPAGPVRLGVAKPLPLTSELGGGPVSAGRHVLKAESF